MTTLKKEALVFSVQQAINNKFPNWVLFRNGTYIVFDKNNRSSKNELKYLATLQIDQQTKLLQHILTFCNATVFPFDDLNGWVVPCTINSAIFTFIHASEFDEEAPSELAISVLSRYKNQDDFERGEIIHVEVSNTLETRQSLTSA
jgi:hypothetical protein